MPIHKDHPVRDLVDDFCKRSPALDRDVMIKIMDFVQEEGRYSLSDIGAACGKSGTSEMMEVMPSITFLTSCQHAILDADLYVPAHGQKFYLDDEARSAILNYQQAKHPVTGVLVDDLASEVYMEFTVRNLTACEPAPEL